MRSEPDQRRDTERSACSDCRVDVHAINEYSYMVHFELWQTAVFRPVLVPNRVIAKRPRLLCIECLEFRLGRMLTPEDFDMRIPLNRLPSKRLRLRRGQVT